MVDEYYDDYDNYDEDYYEDYDGDDGYAAPKAAPKVAPKKTPNQQPKKKRIPKFLFFSQKAREFIVDIRGKANKRTEATENEYSEEKCKGASVCL